MVAGVAGWKEAAVLAVIQGQFPHSLARVLALKLKVSGDPALALVATSPTLARLLCLRVGRSVISQSEHCYWSVPFLLPQAGGV